MCASFLIRPRGPLDLDVPSLVRTNIQDYFDLLITPHRLAPVLIIEEDKVVISPMKFSLLPSWSKEPKVKFATHNARLETLAEKPTWRGPLKDKHCIILMTDFIEPIYTGNLAGNMVAFGVGEKDYLFAAGIWDEWVNKETGEITRSFSIITTEPPEFVKNTGHDRCPVFLTLTDGLAWLKERGKGAELTDWLGSKNNEPKLNAIKFRALKPGWEKRA
jgi:putative SOS response-associated peptidase YedK